LTDTTRTSVIQPLNIAKKESMRSPITILLTGAMVLCGLSVALGRAQASDVSVRVEVAHEHEPAASKHASNAGVVVWLTPNLNSAPSPAPRSTQHYVLMQKDKQFIPHILVVPTGSTVDFPNLDPFFHNVFSLFNGKRFDLGLYEAHTQRTVQFDRDGVSYIFCNIHPEMGAVIVSLSTPYYAISTRDGSVALHDVPPGSYRLHVWAENVPLDHLEALGRNVEIGPQNMSLAAISLKTSGNVMSHHKNKFGESYAPVAKDPY
jgi:plastocyanin